MCHPSASSAIELNHNPATTSTTIIAAVATWRYIPESPVRVPGRVNWLAAALMSVGISVVLIAVSARAFKKTVT